MKTKPQIFVSYSWKDKDIVDQIDKDFQTVGITLIRDVRDLKYKDSIKQYMKRIRVSDFVLMIISNNFLESHNCMFEVLEFVKDESYKNRILPIILPDTNLTPEGKSFYTNYWQDRVDKLENILRKQKLGNIHSLLEDLKIFENISATVADFLMTISDMLCISLEELKSNNYRDILDKVGFDDSNLLNELLGIKKVGNKEEQDIAIDDFIFRNMNYAPGYLFKAYFELERGNFKKSEYYNSKALKLNPEYATVSVNMGTYLDNLTVKKVDISTNESSEVLKKLSYYTKLKEEIDIDLELAAEFQNSLLPSKVVISKLPGVRCDYIFLPFLKVAGDFIDILKLEEGYYGFAIADSSGRGISSGLRTIMLKTFFNLYGQDLLSPELLFEILNTELYRYMNSGEILSCFYGICFVEEFGEEKKIVYSNANQPPPFAIFF
ncbi:MAG: TIR domain-containing protein [Candidatus Aminicenantes bacterium]|nr:MAG: TIR domain-containing protein [Candidatus Aminicenantes bacterium]